jgi:hypothetical protein
MTADKYLSLISTLVHVLNELDASRDVEACLGEFVSKGIPKSAGKCPVALYLTDKVGSDADVKITLNYVHFRVLGGVGESIELPDSVTKFIEWFDYVRAAV